MALAELHEAPALRNVVPIRRGMPIPLTPREEDISTHMAHRVSNTSRQRAIKLAYASNSPDKYLEIARAQTLADGFEGRLPRNNLEVIHNPLEVSESWFWQALNEAQLAISKAKWLTAQWSFANFHDQRLGTRDSAKLQSARGEARDEADAAIARLVRTPVIKIGHVKLKQQLLGNREWARS